MRDIQYDCGRHDCGQYDCGQCHSGQYVCGHWCLLQNVRPLLQHLGMHSDVKLGSMHSDVKLGSRRDLT